MRVQWWTVTEKERQEFQADERCVQNPQYRGMVRVGGPHGPRDIQKFGVDWAKRSERWRGQALCVCV